MIIPYSTDAPIYHFPFATVALIATNVGVFMVTCRLDDFQQEEYLVPWILQYGTLNPLQWITSNFIHAGFLHLVGNMFGLWSFGLVVEGKVGWHRFLAIVLGIGISQCAVEQTLMLGAEEGASYGISSVVFGLVAISLIWAPWNEMSCVIVMGWRMLNTELTVLTLGEIMIGIELVVGLLSGLPWGSQLLHMMGAGFGLVVGIVMLKRKWVDCENWDLFSVWKGDHYKTISEHDEDAMRELLGDSPGKRPGEPAVQGTSKGKGEPSATPAGAASVSNPMETNLNQVRQLIQNGNPSDAFLAHRRFAATVDGWCLPERESLGMISAYHRHEMWSESIPVMVEYLQTYQARETQVRLRLAQILLTNEDRPAQALHVLQTMNEALLEPGQADLVTKLRNKAQRRREEGVIETEVDDW